MPLFIEQRATSGQGHFGPLLLRCWALGIVRIWVYRDVTRRSGCAGRSTFTYHYLLTKSYVHVPGPDLCCFIYSGVRCRFHFMDATGGWSAVRPTTSIAEFGFWAYLRRLYLPLSPSLHDLHRYVFRFPLFIFTCHLILSIFRRLFYYMIYLQSITYTSHVTTHLSSRHSITNPGQHQRQDAALSALFHFQSGIVITVAERQNTLLLLC